MVHMNLLCYCQNKKNLILKKLILIKPLPSIQNPYLSHIQNTNLQIVFNNNIYDKVLNPNRNEEFKRKFKEHINLTKIIHHFIMNKYVSK